MFLQCWLKKEKELQNVQDNFFKLGRNSIMSLINSVFDFCMKEKIHRIEPLVDINNQSKKSISDVSNKLLSLITEQFLNEYFFFFIAKSEKLGFGQQWPLSTQVSQGCRNGARLSLSRLSSVR